MAATGSEGDIIAAMVLVARSACGNDDGCFSVRTIVIMVMAQLIDFTIHFAGYGANRRCVGSD